MAEAAGLTVGVIALAGLFNSTVECFEFVQLGRAFEKDFKTAQLKLDTFELRLSRWGASLGLNRDLQPAQISTDTFGTKENVAHAKDLLSQILELFAEAEGVSIKFKDRTGQNSSALAICDPQADLTSAAMVLHNDMRKLAIERQGKTSLRRRAKWALYEEKRFKRLLEDIGDLVDGLVGLFPAGHAAQERLCEAEVAIFGQNAEAPLLKEIVAKQDKLLESALKKILDDAQHSQHAVFSGDHNEGSQVGFNSGTISNTFGKRT
jgi:hypothetical protein